MAAVIPEAAEAVSSGTEAVEGASARARAGGRTRAPVALGSSNSRARAGGAPRGGQQRERQYRKSARKTGRGVLGARLPGSHSYQPVVLAEFLVAIVLVATGPVAKGGTPTAQAKGSPSPYSVNTLKQLIAIGAVYFVLGLLAASHRAGRHAAWFGGLVLLGLGFTQLANGDLNAVFRIFAPGGSNTSGGGAQASGDPLIAPGVAAPAGPSLQDSGQSGTIPAAVNSPNLTQSQITFSSPGVITSDSGGQLALSDARVTVG